MRPGLTTAALVLLGLTARGQETLDARLARLDPVVTPEAERKALSSAVADDVRRRLRAANDRSSAEWKAVRSRADWERFVRPKVDALRTALGRFPEPTPPRARVTGTV